MKIGDCPGWGEGEKQVKTQEETGDFLVGMKTGDCRGGGLGNR